MVQAYGGHIRAQSAGLNRGATFTVELPLQVDEPTRVLEFRTAHRTPANGSSGSDEDCESDEKLAGRFSVAETESDAKCVALGLG